MPLSYPTFTGCRSALSPSRPRRFRFAKSALVTSGIRTALNIRRASACDLATVVSLRSVPASLRLRSTFPFAKPQAEALS